MLMESSTKVYKIWEKSPKNIKNHPTQVPKLSQSGPKSFPKWHQNGNLTLHSWKSIFALWVDHDWFQRCIQPTPKLSENSVDGIDEIQEIGCHDHLYSKVWWDSSYQSNYIDGKNLMECIAVTGSCSRALQRGENAWSVNANHDEWREQGSGSLSL